MADKPSYSDQVREDKEWFESNHDQLLSKYGVCYLAILRGEILGHDRDLGILLQRTWEKYGLCGFFLADLTSTQRPFQDIDNIIEGVW